MNELNIIIVVYLYFLITIIMFVLIIDLTLILIIINADTMVGDQSFSCKGIIVFFVLIHAK